jgi:alkylated DNA repair dioxygenase AlkB
MTEPKFEYIPDFLTAQDADDLFAWLETQRGFQLEIGQCNGAKPSHATVQWGPRQAYLSCVPKPYRIGSSGDIPEYLMGLKRRLEEKYKCYFDSIQVNKHFDHNASVLPHTDSPPGHICMVSVGAEREFKLDLQGTYKPFASLRLAHGSLLTFPPHDQWKYRHRMLKSKTPCGARYSLIFRYITEALQKSGSIDKQNSAERKQRNRDRIRVLLPKAIIPRFKIPGNGVRA